MRPCTCLSSLLVSFQHGAFACMPVQEDSPDSVISAKIAHEFEVATSTPGKADGTITYKLWDAFAQRYTERTVVGSWKPLLYPFHSSLITLYAKTKSNIYHLWSLRLYTIIFKTFKTYIQIVVWLEQVPCWLWSSASGGTRCRYQLGHYLPNGWANFSGLNVLDIFGGIPVNSASPFLNT